MTTQLCFRAILGKLVELRPGIKDNVLASILTSMDDDNDKVSVLMHAPADGDDIAKGRDTADDAIDRALGKAIDLASPNDLEEAIRTALAGANLAYENWQSIIAAIRDNHQGEPTVKVLCEQFPTAVELDGCVSIWPRVWQDDDDVIHADWEYLKAEAEKHGVPVGQLKDAIEYCWEAWLDCMKSGYLDEATGWHVFCPLGDWRNNDFRLNFTPPESAKKWKFDTYKC